jgi:hypothetical protein
VENTDVLEEDPILLLYQPADRVTVAGIRDKMN